MLQARSRDSPAALGEDPTGAGIHAAAMEGPCHAGGCALKELWSAERPHAAGEECVEEEAAERSCYGLTTAPAPHPPALLWGGGGKGVRNEGVKSSLG